MVSLRTSFPEPCINMVASAFKICSINENDSYFQGAIKRVGLPTLLFINCCIPCQDFNNKINSLKSIPLIPITVFSHETAVKFAIRWGIVEEEKAIVKTICNYVKALFQTINNGLLFPINKLKGFFSKESTNKNWMQTSIKTIASIGLVGASMGIAVYFDKLDLARVNELFYSVHSFAKNLF